ncbi:MAG: hypothetical protein O3C27_17950 [Actinomycetota bacterium]|nr:hypothetical protein [Actinomycetota bacterium]
MPRRSHSAEGWARSQAGQGRELAKATGQGTDIAPELAAGVLAGAKKSIPDAYRGPEGAPFGSQKEAPAGATNADQLAAFLGREL